MHFYKLHLLVLLIINSKLQLLQNGPLLIAYRLSVWKKFQHHSIDGLADRRDRKLWKKFILWWITPSNMLQSLLNFMEIKSSTSIFCSKFKRNWSTRWFSQILKTFLFWCEEEKYKENRAIFKSKYLVNPWRNQRQIWYAW